MHCDTMDCDGESVEDSCHVSLGRKCFASSSSAGDSCTSFVQKRHSVCRGRAECFLCVPGNTAAPEVPFLVAALMA